MHVLWGEPVVRLCRGQREDLVGGGVRRLPAFGEVVGWQRVGVFDVDLAGHGGEGADALQQGQAGVLIVDCGGWFEDVGGLPAAFDGFVDLLDQGGPQRAFGELPGSVGADDGGELVDPLAGDGGGVVAGGGAAEAPPDRGGGVVVRDGSLCRRFGEESGGIIPGPGEFGEVFGELGKVVVGGDGRVDLREELAPFGHRGGGALADLLVEPALPIEAGPGQRRGSGGPHVGGFDLHRGPPHFDVGDHPNRWSAHTGGHPRRVGFGRQRLGVDLAGQVGHELGALGEPGPEDRVVGERGGDGGDPRQRPASCVVQAGVVEPPRQQGGYIAGTSKAPQIDRVGQPVERVDVLGSE